MRVVVVGATGNLGSALLQRLAVDGEVDSVIAAARRIPAVPPPDQSVVWRSVDIASDDLDPLVAGADVVVSLAWLIQPSRDPDATWRTNAVGTARLLEAAARSSSAAVVIASSVAAYSPGAGRVVDESWPTHGASSAAYAREKAYVERLLDSFEATHPDRRVVRVRPAFTFQREAGVEQRRLFLSPLLPNRLVRPDLLPMLPWPRDLAFQVAHASDVANALHAAVKRPVTGAFNLAADDVVDAERAAAIFGARIVPTPPRVARAAMAAAWRGHLTPAPPMLFDALLNLPVMSTERAKQLLEWRADMTAEEALHSFVAGASSGVGGDTPPLAADTSGPLHVDELRSGVGRQP